MPIGPGSRKPFAVTEMVSGSERLLRPTKGIEWSKRSIDGRGPTWRRREGCR